MFIKFLIIASILTTRATFGQFLQPVELNALGSECALILPGGARSSAYDHTLNLFRVGGLNSIQDTSKTCITYDAINAAYLDARKRIHVSQPKGEWKTEDIATVGELLLDISIQLARTVLHIAIIQQITYNEFLPILLGKEVMEKFGLVLQKDGYWDGYDPKINPSIIDSFAAAAFRFGHSLLPTAVERWSKAHKFISSKRLSDLIRRPFDLYRAGVFDEYLMGLMNQVAQAMDDSITQEVTNHLFKKDGNRFGHDLVSFNMQRGREFGVPGYMEFRKFCGLSVANTWEELGGLMANETIYRYQSIFEHPADIDLWSGGVSEKSLPGSMLGPTFACIIATQMSYIRRGDRFWYELPNQPSSFSPEQLQELRKAKLSRVICDNTDLIDVVQIYPMVLPDHEINPRVPCKSGIIPTIDLTKWADYGPDLESPQFNVLNEIPNTVKFLKNVLRRRKRSNGDVYEYYESKKIKQSRPNRHHEMTRAVYTMKTESKLGNNGQKEPKRQERLTFLRTNRRPTTKSPEPPEHVASEVDDLANDEHFYKQLEKHKPTTENSAEVEEIHPIRPHINREVVFIHGGKNKQRERQNQQMTRFNYQRPELTKAKDDDTYSDYGEMEENPDADVEMHDTFEPNTKEGYVQVVADKKPKIPQIMHTNFGRPQHVPFQRPTCEKKRPFIPNVRPNMGTLQSIRVPVRGNNRPFFPIQPMQKQRSEQNKLTKKLNTPEELHAEIDKIFQLKNANYNKRGHDRSYWELRIVPASYKTHEEFINV